MKDAKRTGPQDEFASRLDALFRRPLMSYFLRRVGSPAEAEDLTQQVFLRLLASGDAGQIDHASAYIFTIAGNLLKDRGRRAARRKEGGPSLDEALVGDLAEALSEARTPERVLLGKQSLAEVLATLGELDERTRDVFILFRLEHMKQREIAALYGIGESTVERLVSKAALHLLRKYGPN
jgi:RNA polymerase sigma factor (sigma-70 family)